MEKTIVILAALKSFSEGLGIAADLLRKVGRALSRKPAPSSVDKATAPVTGTPVPTPVIEHHHHHYYGAPPGPQPQAHQWDDPTM